MAAHYRALLAAVASAESEVISRAAEIQDMGVVLLLLHDVAYCFIIFTKHDRVLAET